MPYYHCKKCHHEFEACKEDLLKCDWCGAKNPKILEDETPLELMCKDYEIILDVLKKGNPNGN